MIFDGTGTLVINKSTATVNGFKNTTTKRIAVNNDIYVFT